jgi:hypothetical protein
MPKLTIQAVEGGTTDPAPGTYEYPFGATVTVTAIPDKGWIFDWWEYRPFEVPTETRGNQITFWMYTDVVVIPHFIYAPPPPTPPTPPPKVYLTIQVATPGLGTTSPPPGTYDYDQGTTVTVVANPYPYYAFDHWEFDGQVSTVNPVSLKLDRDTVLKAYFKSPPPPTPKVYLTIQRAPPEGGTTIPAPGVHAYDPGSKVTAMAFPAPGWSFDRWYLPWGESRDNPISFTINEDMVITAGFTQVAPPPPVPKVRLYLSAFEGGTTDPAPGVYEVDSGSAITVRALPSPGYRFDHWALDGKYPTDNPITLTLTSDTTLTAIFAAVPPPGKKVRLSVRVEPEGSGSTEPPPGDHEYIAGTSLTVRAIPAEGYELDHWALDGEVHAENPIAFTISSDVVLVAYFRARAAPPPTLPPILPPPPPPRPPVGPSLLGLGASTWVGLLAVGIAAARRLRR